MDQETLSYDVVIVGAGPAGLAAAIRLLQQAQKHQISLKVCILEKGAEVGAHLLSGAVLEPRSLQLLLPDEWHEAPLDTPVKQDSFYFLTQKRAFKLPTPPTMHNQGNYIISIGQLGVFLAKKAEALGCEIFPGFSASEILYNEEGTVIGVATGSVGRDKQGNPTNNYQPGIRILAKHTFFAEGCRGELSEQLIQKFALRESPQSYGLGIKELWRIAPEQSKPGLVIHTIGWPLDRKTYGGSFIYHMQNNVLSVGFVVALDYQNPWLSPFEEMQRFKTHPRMRHLFEGGERIGFGARALNEGGYQAIPKLVFPGGSLLGDAAGTLDAAKIKGIHNAIESGILAADAYIERVLAEPTVTPLCLDNYMQAFQESYISKTLYKVRNIRPGFHYGLWFGLLNAGLEMYIFGGKTPWTFRYKCGDQDTLIDAKNAPQIEYPKPDGKITFDRLSSVYLSNTFHDENQPCHLKLHDPKLAIGVNYRKYASPETRYCPAAVYEIVNQDTIPKLLIHAQNCIHCKTCDIKDPRQNIKWTAPEGGGGPHYMTM
ncbi:MAG: electron transfer flavoprotein-ubiquinone oxidoreductase [Legionellaceae bacterium]|nr:electron transfer flavoprotein-ubiquinone oxidoreductase [Legionellaceae bacterium]